MVGGTRIQPEPHLRTQHHTLLSLQCYRIQSPTIWIYNIFGDQNPYQLHLINNLVDQSYPLHKRIPDEPPIVTKWLTIVTYDLKCGSKTVMPLVLSDYYQTTMSLGVSSDAKSYHHQVQQTEENPSLK